MHVAMKRWGRAVTVAAAMAAAAVTAMPGASAAPTTSQLAAPSEIRTFADKCLDVYGFVTDDGTRIVQYTCNGKANQHFRI